VSAARLVQEPGWAAGVVRIVCDTCGYRSALWDVRDEQQRPRAQAARERHTCKQTLPGPEVTS
jgi:hypothetical protein